MTAERSFPGDSRAVALHDRTADRLLAGTLAPADVPPGYEGVAELVRAATAAARPDELAGERRAFALLVEAVAPPAVVAASAASSAPPAPSRVSSLRPRPQPVTATCPSRWWAGRGARVAAVAAALILGGGAGMATLVGGEKRSPTTSADPAPDADPRATIQGTQGPPLSEPTTSAPTTVARPPAPTPPALSPAAPSVVAPAAPAPVPPQAPVPVPPPAPPATAPPTTAPPLPEECADIERLPAGMRSGLDSMARGFGFPSFAEMCRVGAQYSSGSSTWWSGTSSRGR